MPIPIKLTTCFLVAGLPLAALQATACWDSRCGPGERYEGAACIPIPDGAAQDGSADAKPGVDARPDDAAADGAPPGDSGADGADSGLGATCTKQEECDGAADFCAIQPGTPSGYCTFQGCEVGGTDCPAPYFCMDLSAFGAPITACIKV